jgi:hypothetical protein
VTAGEYALSAVVDAILRGDALAWLAQQPRAG